MRELFTVGLGLLFFTGTQAQIQRAHLNEDHTIEVETIPLADPVLFFRQETFAQMEGFPKGARANNTYKNFRNVTLVDLNGDGAQDIIWGANSRLFADSYRERLWIRTLRGTVIYPCSVADLDKNGVLDIVQPTGGSRTDSRIYLLDPEGRDQPGWPLDFDGHWILSAAALADVNGDGEIEVIFGEHNPPESRLHIVKPNGESFSDQWPVTITGTPAITPSIGDVDNDGATEIYIASTTTRYLFDLNGHPEPGWPQTTDPAQRYSYQSPVLADLNNDGDLEIIGATHGKLPEYYVLQADNTPLSPWPKPVPGNTSTFNTPTVVKIDGAYKLFMARPITDRTGDMLYGWNAEGRSLENFPLFKSGGLEGFISIADVDNDGEFELVCGSNLLLEDGLSFIHAFNLDDLTEVPGFPIRPHGWTFMNGVNIGDVNGDGQMDLVALSYTQNFDPNIVDSIYLNVYELKVPYHPDRVLWSTYRGNNTRDGLLTPANVTPVRETAAPPSVHLSLSPNPVRDQLLLEIETPQPVSVRISLIDGRGGLLEEVFRGEAPSGSQQWSHPVNHLPPGLYCINVVIDRQTIQSLKFIKN